MTSNKWKNAISYIVLTIASLLSVFPLYYMISGATNKSIDIVRGRLIPGTYLMENFKSLTTNQNLGLAMFNSFRNAIIITILTLLICSIAGYGFEIYHDKGLIDEHSFAGYDAAVCGTDDPVIYHVF